MSSFFISPQLIDVGAATQTPFAQRAMMDLVQFEQDYSTEYPERLLLALAYSTHPGEYLLKDLIVCNQIWKHFCSDYAENSNIFIL